jgi:hypothetical protein
MLATDSSVASLAPSRSLLGMDYNHPLATKMATMEIPGGSPLRGAPE